MDYCEAEQWMKSIWLHMKQEHFPESDYSRVVQFFKYEKQAATTGDTLFTTNVISQIAFIAERLGKLEKSSLTNHAATAIAAELFPGTTHASESLSKTVDIVLKLMLTLNIRSISSTQTWTSRALPSVIDWGGDINLSQAIASHFRRLPPMSFDTKPSRIDPAMTMAYLCMARNLAVSWTSNLADHLTINWRTRVVTVYEHKIYLWNHLNSKSEPMIPREILEEAIDTLNLLFPLNDARTKDFLKRNGRPFYGLGNCKRDRVSDLGRFQIWRNEVAGFMEIMNEEPKGLQQLVLSNDRRNLMSFAAFWVATFVAILTIISIAFGTVQTVYSIKQYNLAVAQACSDPTAKDVLTQYCS